MFEPGEAVPGSGRVVFLFAHQDDEYGVFSAIEEEAAAGTRPACVYLTSGAPRGRSGARRDRESLVVLGALGVDAANVRFLGSELGIPDAELYLHLESARQAFMATLMSIGSIRRLYVPAWEGGHQDHDATHLVGLAVARGLGLLERTRQFALYHGAGLPWIFFRVLSPLADNGVVEQRQIPWRRRLAYVRHLLAYPSQAATWVGLFPFVSLDILVKGRQRLQPVRLDRLRMAPHIGPPLFERRGVLSRARLEEVARPFMDRWLPAQDSGEARCAPRPP